MDLVLVGVCWTLYYALHSLFLSEGVKQKIKNSFSWTNREYRLSYSLISSIGLALLIFQYFQLPKSELTEEDMKWMRFVGALLMGLSIWMMFRSFKPYSIRVFFGLDEDAKKPILNTKGMNELVRHPLYLSLFVFLMGALLLEANDLFSVIFVISVLYLYIGAWLEEKKLVKVFGKKYIKYQSEVPMLIPSLF